MEANVSRKKLLNQVQKIQSVIEKKSTMPVLSHTLIRFNNKLQTIATDLEIAFKGEIDAEIIQPGEVLVPARPLYDILRNLEDETLKMTTNKSGWLEIYGSKSHFTLVSMPSSEFPGFPEIDAINLIPFEGQTLRQGILKTAFSMAKEEENSRYAGLCLEKKEGSLRLVSTDTFRLTYIDIPFEGLNDLQFEKQIMIPRKAVSEILKFTDYPKIFIGADNQSFVIKGENENQDEESLLYVRLMESKFPDYEGLIPEDSRYQAIIPKAEFKGLLKRMSSIMTEKVKAGHFFFYPQKLVVKIEDLNVGSAEEEMAITLKGNIEDQEYIKVILNINLLLEIINVLDDDNFYLGINLSRYPCVINSERDIGFKALIAPIIEEGN